MLSLSLWAYILEDLQVITLQFVSYILCIYLSFCAIVNSLKLLIVQASCKLKSVKECTQHGVKVILYTMYFDFEIQ